MTNSVDYYDVQAMIRDARSEIRGEINNAVRDATREAYAVIADLAEQVASLQRVIASRTEHLV